MIVLLIAGVACLALAAFQVSRPRIAADRQRRAALETVRSAAVFDAGAPGSGPEATLRSMLAGFLPALIVWITAAEMSSSPAIAVATRMRRPLLQVPDVRAAMSASPVRPPDYSRPAICSNDLFAVATPIVNDVPCGSPA